MAEDDLDLMVHLGDYIYEYPIAPSAGERSTSVPRRFNTEINTHEVENNYADEVSENDVPPENFLERQADAYQAYFEHMPLRPSRIPTGPDLPLYRRFTFGDLVEFNVLDTCQYRSDQTSSVEEAKNPDRTLLGDVQEDWLIDGLASSSS